MTLNPLHPHLITYDRKTIDLQSASATRTPKFIFPTRITRSSNPNNSPIAILSCANPFATCLHIKSWLLDQHREPAYSAPGILRMDHLELEKIDPRREGWVVVAPDAAELDGREWLPGSSARLKVSILAVLIKGDERVRWFYTLCPVSGLLTLLDQHGLVDVERVLEPCSPKHARFATFMREGFTHAIKMPEAPDFIAAQAISDFCPSILDPDGAVGRLEEDNWLYWNTPKPEEFLSAPEKAGSELQPSDDRYLHHLHPAEREVASLARLKCAEYLFLKRNFFRAFFEELYRSEKIIDVTASPSTSNPVTLRGNIAQVVRDTASPTPSTRYDTPHAGSPAPSSTQNTASASARTPARQGRRGGGGYDKTKRARVRTERAHQVWLENNYHLRTTAARTLVVGWRVLGFLDEGRYLGWIKDGWGGDED